MEDKDVNEHYEIADNEDELEALKARANMLGISYSPNISVATLRKRVAAALDSGEEDKPAEAAKPKGKSQKELQDEASKLIRVRISCHDPMKKEYTGEIFTVLNNVVGVYKRFVQFNEPWHVPAIILEQIKDKKYQQFYSVKDERGNTIRKSKLVNAYSIEYLPALTEDELAKLAADQKARKAVD